MVFYSTSGADSSTIFDDEMIAFVRARRRVSFVELLDFFEERGVPSRGKWAVTLGWRDNLILWPGVRCFRQQREAYENALCRLMSAACLRSRAVE